MTGPKRADAADVAPPVVHNATANRFEVVINGDMATLIYGLTPGVIDLQHTSVPGSLRGRGLASALAHAALEYARQAKLKVIPTCPFVRTYLTSHPEYADLVVR